MYMTLPFSKNGTNARFYVRTNQRKELYGHSPHYPFHDEFQNILSWQFGQCQSVYSSSILFFLVFSKIHIGIPTEITYTYVNDFAFQQDSMCVPISGKNYMDIAPTIHFMKNSRIFSRHQIVSNMQIRPKYKYQDSKFLVHVVCFA